MWSRRRLASWLRLAMLLMALGARVATAAPSGLWGADDDDGGGDPDTLQELEYGDEDAKKQVDEEIEGAEVNLQLTQFDYSDACVAIADARWRWLLAGQPASGKEEAALWEKEAALSHIARDNLGFMKPFATVGEHTASAPEELVDQIHYALHPGDLILSEQEYQQKLNYSHAVHRALAELEVPCGGTEPGDCVMTLPVIRRVLARSGDAAQLLRVWSEAQAALRPFARGFPAQLQLARAAAVANDISPDETEADPHSRDALVEAYWRVLQDPDNYLELTYTQIRRLWTQLRPLHRQLVEFVHARLRAAYGDAALAVAVPLAANETLLPAHLIGSLEGDDWSPLANLVYPHKNLRSIDSALKEKELIGKSLFETAFDTLEGSLGVEDLPLKTFLQRVHVDGQCPANYVYNCSDGAIKVLTCSRSSWEQYAEAHELAARMAYEKLGLEEDKNSLLRVVTRHSALHDALPLMVRVLSLHPDRLEELELLPDDEEEEDSAHADGGSDAEEEEEEAAMPRAEAWLRLLPALRVLPRLAFLAAVDEFRLQMLAARTNVTGTPEALWAQVRREYMLVATPAGVQSDAGWLAVAEATRNEPLLGRFAAELLAFQVLEEMAAYDRDHPLRSIHDHAIISPGDLMKLGRSRRWPDIINDYLDTNEIRAEPLLRYFAPLQKLLTAAEAAKAPAAEKRAPVDLSPPSLPAPDSPTAPSPSFFAPAPSPTDVNPSPDGLPRAASTEHSPSGPEAAVPSSDGAVDPSVASPDAKVRTASADSSTRTAVLAASLTIFALALVAGAFVGGQRLLRKRGYQRNRRPDAPTTTPATANGDVPTAATSEEDTDPEAQPVNKEVPDDEEEDETATPISVTETA